jgi:S-layer protein (TIGR01567 family)
VLAILFLAVSIDALEIRGKVMDLGMNDVVWASQDFAGFAGDESLVLKLTDVDAGLSTASLSNWNGVVYTTNVQQVEALRDAKEGDTYGKLTVASIDSMTGKIILDNRNSYIALSKNKRIELTPGFGIRTADQADISADNPLRFYIYKEVMEPGTYELKGALASSANGSFTWSPQNFAGFYYDIDRNIGTETLTLSPTTTGKNVMISDEEGARGMIYRTIGQTKYFKFKPWGGYQIIGFLGQPYFAAYNNDVTPNMQASGEAVPFIADKSKNDNLMTNEQLSRILIDNDSIVLVKKGESLKLKDGYELLLKGVNSQGQVFLQLLKDGHVIDESILGPSIDNAMMADKTYYYRKDLGDMRDVVIIAVHFRSTYRDEEQALAKVDGVWQISDTPSPIEIDQQFGKMSIRNIDPTAFVVTMDNKDNQISLSRNMDVELMPSIYLHTDNNEPLNYYIYKKETIT